MTTMSNPGNGATRGADEPTVLPATLVVLVAHGVRRDAPARAAA